MSRIGSFSFSGREYSVSPIMSAMVVEDTSKLPCDHRHPRPHMQVRHLLPSVVTKQGLLQSNRAKMEAVVNGNTFASEGSCQDERLQYGKTSARCRCGV